VIRTTAYQAKPSAAPTTGSTKPTPRAIRRLAIVGCGFVADMYARSFDVHPQLNLHGAFDVDASRARRFAAYHRTHCYNSISALLDDPDVDLVLNLTNPHAHYEVSRACIASNKHVYSEKPIALRLGHVRELIDLAQQQGVLLSAAPCSLLGETAQTLWKAVRENEVGRIRAAYAELDDGMVHRMPYQHWLSESGAPWPYKDEMEVGNVLEHAGYYVTWLVAFFGPVESITAFGSLQLPDKESDDPIEKVAADFSVACLRFSSGVVARLTCSIIAPHDHSLTIVGDDGVLGTNDCWFFRSPVWVRRRIRIRRRVLLMPWRRRLARCGRRHPLPKYRAASRMDWLRGVADMAQALEDGRDPRLSPDFVYHVCEVMLQINNALCAPGHRVITSTFAPIEPMPWAVD
jgi:predicted dehydrogenase